VRGLRERPGRAPLAGAERRQVIDLPQAARWSPSTGWLQAVQDILAAQHPGDAGL